MNKEMGGGSLYEVGCYWILAIRSILESEPLSVHTNAEIDARTGIDLTTWEALFRKWYCGHLLIRFFVMTARLSGQKDGM